MPPRPWLFAPAARVGVKAAIPGQVASQLSAAARAERVLAENALGVGRVDGRMVDEAVVRQARAMLAGRPGLRPGPAKGQSPF